MTTAIATRDDFALTNLGALFHPHRLEMAGWMTAGLVGGAATATALWLGLPEIAPAAEPVARIGQVFSWAMVPGLVVLASVSSCMRMFDTLHAMDPLAQDESRFYKINNRVLVNTVEQAVIFLPALLALGFLLEGSWFRAVPVLALTWAAARVAFWAGYQLRVSARGAGMTATLTLSVVAYALAGATLWA